jgi:hypothetical protein
VDPQIAPVTAVKLVNHRMILRKPGKCRIGKHQRAVEDLVGMNDGRHEALDVAAVKDGFFLLGRVLVRMHRKDVSDARQIFRSLIERHRRQLKGLRFLRSDVFCRRRKIRRGFQAGLLNGQPIIVLVGARLRVGQQDDVVRVADGGILGRRAAHIDDITRAGCELVGLNYRDILKRARLAVADEAIGIQCAGKIRPVQTITRFQNIEHADDAARLAQMRQVDFNAFAERFFFE